jgi:hypothetical protein
MCCPDEDIPVNSLRSAQLLNLLSSEAGFELTHEQRKISEMMEMIGSGKNGNGLLGAFRLCHNAMDELDISGDNLSGVITDLSPITQCP